MEPGGGAGGAGGGGSTPGLASLSAAAAAGLPSERELLALAKARGGMLPLSPGTEAASALALHSPAAASPEAGSPSAAAPSAPSPDWYPQELIAHKHREYSRGATTARLLYYATRWTSGVAAIGMALAVLEATGPTLKFLGLLCSALILLGTLVDTIHDPKGRWKLFSSATEQLALADLRRRGEYPKYREQLRILRETENAKLGKLTDLAHVVDSVRKGTRHGG